MRYKIHLECMSFQFVEVESMEPFTMEQLDELYRLKRGVIKRENKFRGIETASDIAAKEMEKFI